jgi:hypothetical protein
MQELTANFVSSVYLPTYLHTYVGILKKYIVVKNKTTITKTWPKTVYFIKIFISNYEIYT